MAGHHFISYSGADARRFALRLQKGLETGTPPVPAWLDKRQLKAGRDWDAQLEEAIRDCASLIFIMTEDSVEDQSVCKLE